MKYNPVNDGIDHINIYSKGKTELGRWLSNFSKVHLDLVEDGEFESIEAYWYWLIAKQQGYKDEWDLHHLRKTHGFDAKQSGRLLTSNKDWLETEEFKNKIKTALSSKILGPAGKKFLKEFEESTLPFTHYYNYSGKIVEPKNGKWVIDYIEELRRKQKKFRSNHNA